LRTESKFTISNKHLIRKSRVCYSQTNGRSKRFSALHVTHGIIRTSDPSGLSKINEKCWIPPFLGIKFSGRMSRKMTRPYVNFPIRSNCNLFFFARTY
jgi:hypothetical protein